MEKTIKLIDLFNKIANEEEIPKKIRYNNMIMTYNENKQDYYDNFGCRIDWQLTIFGGCLNDLVEIIEDTPISKLYVNNELQYNLTPKKEKKIPKKLEDILEIDDLAPKIDNNMFKILVQVIKNQHRINDICDYLEYLKNKGE